jgi:tRNA (cytidine/uridine-2'-O-)-methyltransferase
MTPSSFDLHLVLVYPDIHWNTGNAGRSCLAFGAMLHLVEPLGFSLEEARVRRAGLDYWRRVPLEVHADWQSFATRLPELGDPWFLSAEGPRSLPDVELARRCVFVLGSETEGLPEAIRRERRDRLVRIPQAAGSVRSLNLSTAAALCLYEYRRRYPHANPGDPGRGFG